jgi:protease PrsW
MSVQNVQSPAGGGAPRRTLHNRNMKWAIGAGIALVVAGILGLLTLGLIGMGVGIPGLVVGMILATAPVPLYLFLALWLDRIEAEPPWMLATAFIWGATVSVFFSFIFNTLNTIIAAMVLGQGAAALIGPVVSAPIVEETSKALVLFILYFWKKDEFDGVVDGVVYAAMVGLGFAMTENIQYYGKSIQMGAIGPPFLFVLRGMISPFAHPLFTSMTGIGLGIARQTDKAPLKIIAPIAGLLMAMVLHAIWNFSGTPMGLISFAITYILFMVPTFAGVLYLIFYSLRREGAVLREHLAPEVQSGALSQTELDEICSGMGRIRRSMNAYKKGGLAACRACGQFSQAASDLAFHRRRVARGVVPAGQDTTDSETEYLESMRELRKQF